MAKERTYYQVLRASRHSTHEGLRAAYLRQARRFHPDVVGGDLADIGEAEREIRLINEAWEVLADPSSKKTYDRTLPVLAAEVSYEPAAIDETDSGGQPIVGVARAVMRLAPVSFVLGFGVLILGGVMQAGALWRSGLAILLLSLVSFMLAPFLVMSSTARHSDD
ncbi:MAG: J domain-containing protein [Actinobacteria bacterium]|nr:J domain-containing protein [Actinomycetota bacterium]